MCYLHRFTKGFRSGLLLGPFKMLDGPLCFLDFIHSNKGETFLLPINPSQISGIVTEMSRFVLLFAQDKLTKVNYVMDIVIVNLKENISQCEEKVAIGKHCTSKQDCDQKSDQWMPECGPEFHPASVAGTKEQLDGEAAFQLLRNECHCGPTHRWTRAGSCSGITWTV